jgi:uncharacterized protein YcbK (DUF882 family)
VKVLQDVTDAFDAYIIITGGNRCRVHNRKLREDYDSSDGKRGAKTACNSQHIHARAADFKLYRVSDRKQIDPDLVYAYLIAKYPDSLGIGLYSNRVHVDTKTGKSARWVA